MTTRRGQRSLQAQLTRRAHQHLVDYTNDQGITITALLEALAPHLEAETEQPGSGLLGDQLTQAVKQARQIDSQRRRAVANRKTKPANQSP